MYCSYSLSSIPTGNIVRIIITTHYTIKEAPMRNWKRFRADDVKADAVWKKNDVAYVVEGHVAIEAANGVTVTVRPGAEFLFKDNAYLSVGESDEGTFIAEGSASDSISFAVYSDGTKWGYGTSATYSGGIWIDEMANANTSLKYCSIRAMPLPAFISIPLIRPSGIARSPIVHTTASISVMPPGSILSITPFRGTAPEIRKRTDTVFCYRVQQGECCTFPLLYPFYKFSFQTCTMRR